MNGNTAAGLKTVLGVVVLGLLLIAMVFGSGVLDSKSDESGGSRTADLPPDQRAEIGLKSGNWALAEEAYREMLAADQFDSRSMLYLGFTLHNEKKLDEAREWYLKSSEFNNYKLVSHYNLACIAAVQDRPDDAIKNLQIAISGGFTSPKGIDNDENFVSLHDDPEFQSLVLREEETRRDPKKKRRR